MVDMLDLYRREPGVVYPAWTSNRRAYLERTIRELAIFAAAVGIQPGVSVFRSDVATYRVEIEAEGGAKQVRAFGSARCSDAAQRDAMTEVVDFLLGREEETEMVNTALPISQKATDCLIEIHKAGGSIDPTEQRHHGNVIKALKARGLVRELAGGALALTLEGVEEVQRALTVPVANGNGNGRRKAIKEVVSRAREPEPEPALARVVIGVDPAGGAAETGVVVARLGVDGDGYVLDDVSLQDSPEKWAAAVVRAYGEADTSATPASITPSPEAAVTVSLPTLGGAQISISEICMDVDVNEEAARALYPPLGSLLDSLRGLGARVDVTAALTILLTEPGDADTL